MLWRCCFHFKLNRTPYHHSSVSIHLLNYLPFLLEDVDTHEVQDLLPSQKDTLFLYVDSSYAVLLFHLIILTIWFPFLGGKDGSYRSLMPDIVSWIAQNPPPAHFLLISGDEDFASILHRLRMSNYNILLSCPDVGSKMLRSAATFMWPWEPLVRGVDLEPKYLNQPPDGLSSWYGQYREYGHDLLLKPKKSMALQWNAKEHKVPKSVVIGIKQVLDFYPEGISVSNLRLQLFRINVFIDKGYFGFKKFSTLLKAMPDVVKSIDRTLYQVIPSLLWLGFSRVQ